MPKTTPLIVFVALVAVAGLLYSQGAGGKPEWPQWRGADREGRSTEAGLLKQWPAEGPPKVWSISGLGEGYSGISVVDGRIYTMGTRADKEYTFCLDFDTGKEVWATPADVKVFSNNKGNGPRATPTIDDGRVYVESGYGVVSCLDAKSGKRAWAASLTKDLGGRVPSWGYSESPLVEGNLLIVTPGGRRGAIVALNKKTGRPAWQSKGVTNGAGYSSPIAVTVKGKRQIIQMLGQRGRTGLMVGVDARTGKPLWQTSKGVANITCCTPVYHEGIAVATSGYGQGTGAADISGGRAREMWFIATRGSHHGGIVRVGDHVYGFIDRMTCIELKTGDVKWQDRGVGKGSLTYADGMFFCLSEGNTVGLVEATPEGYREKGRFRIPSSGKPSWAHPVVCGGRLFIRNQDTLTCWDVKAR